MVISVSPGFANKILSLFAFLLLPTIWLPEQRSRYSDSLRDGQFGIQISVAAIFCALVQSSPVAHQASCRVDAVFLSQGYSGQDVALTTHPQLASKLKKK